MRIIPNHKRTMTMISTYPPERTILLHLQVKLKYLEQRQIFHITLTLSLTVRHMNTITLPIAMSITTTLMMAFVYYS